MAKVTKEKIVEAAMLSMKGHKAVEIIAHLEKMLNIPESRARAYYVWGRRTRNLLKDYPLPPRKKSVPAAPENKMFSIMVDEKVHAFITELAIEVGESRSTVADAIIDAFRRKPGAKRAFKEVYGFYEKGVEQVREQALEKLGRHM